MALCEQMGAAVIDLVYLHWGDWSEQGFDAALKTLEALRASVRPRRWFDQCRRPVAPTFTGGPVDRNAPNTQRAGQPVRWWTDALCLVASRNYVSRMM